MAAGAGVAAGLGDATVCVQGPEVLAAAGELGSSMLARATAAAETLASTLPAGGDATGSLWARRFPADPGWAGLRARPVMRSG